MKAIRLITRYTFFYASADMITLRVGSWCLKVKNTNMGTLLFSERSLSRPFILKMGHIFVIGWRSSL